VWLEQVDDAIAAALVPADESEKKPAVGTSSTSGRRAAKGK
jgi:hypothetical protein